MEDLEILNKFLKSNINIHPLALQELKKTENVSAIVDKIISETQKAEKKPEVITLDFLESLQIFKSSESNLLLKTKTTEQSFEGTVLVERRKKRFLAEEYEAELKIKKDITNNSFSNGNLEGFVEYFNDRYERLAKILRSRNHLRDAATIEWIKKPSFRGNAQIIGMVSEVRKSQRGHVILEVEDPTGVIPVIILNSNHELLELSKEIVKDEVIGIEGNLGKSKDIVIANEIFFPDVPNNKEQKKSEVPLALAIISDTHVGSTKFLENEFLKFLKWLNGDIGNVKQMQLAEKVKYLIVGGDLVDGVGIYPEQEGELLIKDIHAQYQKIAEFLSMVPKHIEIIVLPGNHDAVRQAEPQPAISEEFAGKLYSDPRVRMVGNPCYVTLHGVDVLSYHGRSLDDVISNIPGMSYSQPDKAMLTLIKKRHLAPIYGDKVPLAPEVYDYMLIDEVPDIFHFGHVHTVGVTNYRGVTLINSGTFQQQTSFQRKLNMVPTPAIVPVVDLQKQVTTKMMFR